MKTEKIILLLLAMVLIITNCKSVDKTEESLTVVQLANSKGSLKIILKNVDNNKGNLMVALIAEKDLKDFPNVKETEVSMFVPAEKGETIVEIPDLPYGRYAIAVYHDEDMDGDLDFSLGMNGAIGGIPILPSWPTEGYGFSESKFSATDVAVPGPVSGKKAAFVFDGNNRQVDVHMSYYWKKFGIFSVALIAIIFSALGA